MVADGHLRLPEPLDGLQIRERRPGHGLGLPPPVGGLLVDHDKGGRVLLRRGDRGAGGYLRRAVPHDVPDPADATVGQPHEVALGLPEVVDLPEPLLSLAHRRVAAERAGAVLGVHAVVVALLTDDLRDAALNVYPLNAAVSGDDRVLVAEDYDGSVGVRQAADLSKPIGGEDS